MEELAQGLIPINYIIIALIASGARFLIAKDPPTIRLLLGSILWSLLILVAVFEYLVSLFTTSDTGLVNKGLLNLTIAIAAFLAKDLLEILIKLAEQVKVDPLALLRDFLNLRKPKDPE